MNEAEITKRRLRWKCRRGMLELDIFLQTYFDKHYDTLSEEQKQTFARLLEVDDTQLNAWLLKIEQPEHPAFQLMIAEIRDAKTKSE